jgi:hypothetical protein
MKVLKYIGLVLGSLIVLFLVVMSFISPLSHMERAIVTEATPEAIFQVINSYRNFNKWSPWSEIDPNTKYTFEGPEAGVGAKMNWESDNENVGKGSQWILVSEPNKRIKNQMQFGDIGGTYTSEFFITPVEGGTEIKWTYDGDVTGTGLASSMYKLMGLFMDQFLGPVYEQGLVKLKHISEQVNTQQQTPADSTLLK